MPRFWGREGRGWLYVVQVGEDGPIKIGRTTKPVGRRISQLQSANATPLKLIVALPRPDLEAVLHEQFAAQRVRGEWFAASILEPLLEELVAPAAARSRVACAIRHSLGGGDA